jgi:hypothetical protein
MLARIYQPAKTAMQSGRALTRQWVLEFAPGDKGRIDPLMGWTGSTDTQGQVRLQFDTREEALGYAEKHGLAYVLEEPTPRRAEPRAYADNFRYDRIGRWTH